MKLYTENTRLVDDLTHACFFPGANIKVSRAELYWEFQEHKSKYNLENNENELLEQHIVEMFKESEMSKEHKQRMNDVITKNSLI